MAALTVPLPFDTFRDNGCLGGKRALRKTGLVDELDFICRAWRKRCATSCMNASRRNQAVDLTINDVQRSLTHLERNSFLDCRQPGSPQALVSPHELIQPCGDASEDALSKNRPYETQVLPIGLPPKTVQLQNTASVLGPMTRIGVDLGDTSSFKQAGGKKKKAGKAANNWDDNGDEGGKEGGDGGGDNDGGGGSNNNGDGGAGGDGGEGGGDDWNDWETGAGKKKKKGKKAKDEEEKKKREEEEKEKTEETSGNHSFKIDWADDANGDAGDDWGGFTTSKKKKDKKNKTDEKTNGPNAFHDISLDDTPKIELSFGGNDKKDKKDSGFGSLGGWNPSSWATGGEWSFGNEGATDTVDAFSKSKSTSDAGDISVWNFSGNKKNNKKKTTTSGFDFGDLGGLDENKEEETQEDKDDDRGPDFTSFGKRDKDKRKKKSALDDTIADPSFQTIGTAITEPGLTADNSWDAWGTTSSKKKSAKKDEKNPLPPATAESAVDEWGAYGAKKNKKGGKKITEIEEATTTVLQDLDADADIGGWGSYNKRDNKKPGKKDLKDAEEPITALPEPATELDFGWGSLGKKDKKKMGKKETDMPLELEGTSFEPDTKAEDDWSAFSPFGTKKENKKKNSIWNEPEKIENRNEESVEPDLLAAGTWNAFSSKKKKGKKDAAEETSLPPPPPSKPELMEEKSILSRTESKKEKRGKKGLISEVNDDEAKATEVKSIVDVTSMAAADTDWMSGWGSTDKKKDKKNKRNSIASSAGNKDDAQAAPPPVPDVPEASSFEVWGSGLKKDKEKKGKKGKAEEVETENLPNFAVDAIKDPLDDDWGADSWGLSAKDKKKKEKEKAKKEKEEIERKAEEEGKAKKEEEEKKKEEEEFLTSLKGLSAKERKRKEKEREKARKEQEEEEKRQKEEEEERLKKEEEEKTAREEAERAAKEEEKTNKKGKAGKRGKTSVSPEVSRTKDLLEDTVPDKDPIEADGWASMWAAGKDKKKTKKGMDFEVPPTAPTPPAQGLTPEDEKNDPIADWTGFGSVKSKGKRFGLKDPKIDDGKGSKKNAKLNDEEIIDSLKSPRDDAKAKDASKEDTPAKAVRSIWGNMGATSTPKAKKDDKKAKPKAGFELEEEDETLDILDEEFAGGVMSKDKSAKLSKTSTKESDKPGNKTSDAKKKGSNNEGKIVKNLKEDKNSEKEKEIPTASKKGIGKNNSTINKNSDEVKKEIAKDISANQKGKASAMSKKSKGGWNEPEETRDLLLDDQADDNRPPKPSKTAMLASKSPKNSSVLQRVRELERKRAEAAGEIDSDSDPDPEPEAEPQPVPPKQNQKSTKSPKPSLKPKSKSVLPEQTQKNPKESVPGSFPVMDDLDDLVGSAPLERERSQKSKMSKASKTRESPESKRPPTPPPEPKEEKAVKKERPRVNKGFWGASSPVAKKDVKKESSKSKDDADISAPSKKEKPAAAALGRSKSTRTAKEIEREKAKASPKSSDSEEKLEKPKKAESRPPKSRGSSFGGLFGSSVPKRTQSRRNSTVSGGKSTSRRVSMDVGDTGLPSPPAEDTPASGKAAKIIGVQPSKMNQKPPAKAKGKASAVPDPYAIDSDDMVIVNPVENPIINSKPSKKNTKSASKEVESEAAPAKKGLPERTRSRRDKKMDVNSKRKSKAADDPEEDIVMVDADPSDEPKVADGPDDMQFITKPRGLQRSSTSAKKSESKGGGLFSAFRKSRRISDPNERLKSRGGAEDEEVAPRKRTVTGGDDSAKRPRRDERRKSARAAEGYVYDAAGNAAATEVEERREERRTRRVEKDRAAKEAEEATLKFEADRRAKRRDVKVKNDRDRKMSKDEEAEVRRQEEKEGRRAAREARRVKEEEEAANRALEDDVLKSRSKRRDTEKSASRPGKSDRRRSTLDPHLASFQTPDEEEARRQRREERRTKTSRRKSSAPVEDYFDSRNGASTSKADNNPYGDNDHTASWVKSQASSPPEPPPVEPTIVEPAPDLRAGNGEDDLLAEENLRRSSHKKPKRSSRAWADPGLEEGPNFAKRQNDLGGVKLGVGAKTYDGRTGTGKRSSWLQKITGGV